MRHGAASKKHSKVPEERPGALVKSQYTKVAYDVLSTHKHSSSPKTTSLIIVSSSSRIGTWHSRAYYAVLRTATRTRKNHTYESARWYVFPPPLFFTAAALGLKGVLLSKCLSAGTQRTAGRAPVWQAVNANNISMLPAAQ